MCVGGGGGGGLCAFELVVYVCGVVVKRYEVLGDSALY